MLRALKFDHIKEVFCILLNNLLLCFRELRKLLGEQESQENFWFRYSLQPEERAAKACACLETILSYFPSNQKIGAFLKKFDSHQRWLSNQIQRAPSGSPTFPQGGQGPDDVGAVPPAAGQR